MPPLTHAREPTKTAAPPRPAHSPGLRPATPFFAPAPRPAVQAGTPAGRTPAAGGRAPLLPATRPAPAAQQRAPNVVASTLEAALDWLPDRLREPATEYAHTFAGYPLLTVLLGYDPLAHRRVARSPEALAKGLLRFSEQGTQLYQAVQQSGALSQAGQLIQREAARYHLDGARLLGLLHELARRYDKYHLYQMVANPDLLLHPLGELAADVWAFAKAVAPPLLELALRALGPRGQQVLDLLHRGQTTFALIMGNPRGFLVNLVGGVKLGFSQFAHNALRHLGNAFTTWLFGDVEGGLRLELPITGAGLFQFGLGVLNLGYAQLRQKLVKRLGPRGEQVVGILEMAAGLVRTLVTEGPAAAGRELLGMARTALDGLKQQVLDGLREWLMQSLLMKGVQKLAMLLSPASALFETLLQTYNTVVFFLERAEKFRDLLTTIVGAISDIATGVLAPAANQVENTLARGLRLALDWLLRLVGLGNVPAKVRQHIEQARHWVDELVDKYLDKFIDLAKKLWHQGKQAAAGAVGAVKGWLGMRQPFATADGQQHTLFFEQVNGKPQLIRASVRQEIEKFLDSLPDSSAKTKAQEQVAKIRLITRTAHNPAHTGPTGQGNTNATDENEITDAVKELSKLLFDLLPVGEALPTLAGGTGKEAHFTYKNFPYTGGKGQSSHAEYLTHESAKDGKGASGENDEWLYAKDQESGWVRMHLIAAAVGGLGSPEYWVAAPTEINTGAAVLASFEDSAEKMVRLAAVKKGSGVRGKDEIENEERRTMLWIDVQVTEYHPPFAPRKAVPGVTKNELHYAKTIVFAHGLYLPRLDAAAGKVDWKRLNEPLSVQTVRLRLPKDTNVYLNATTRTRLNSTGITELTGDGYQKRLRQYIVDEAKIAPFTTVDGSEAESLRSRLLQRVGRATQADLKGDDGKDKVNDLIQVIKTNAGSRFWMELGLELQLANPTPTP